MPLDIEIPVLRGFLTPSEATEWKQSVFTTAGETSGWLLVISPRSYKHRQVQLMSSAERFKHF